MKKVLVINGPNMNMLGLRPADKYGSLTLNEINNLIAREALGFFEVEFFQSNCEGAIVTKIQESLSLDAIVINPAAYTHTSIAIRDALEMFPNPIIEVHMSDVDNRDDFRKINFIRPLATQVFTGLKEGSYLSAIKYLKNAFNML